MSQRPRSSRRLLAIGAAVVALGALCAILLPGRDPGAPAPTRQHPGEAPTAAANHPSGARGTPPSRATAASDDADGAGGDGDGVAPSRREQYTAAFDRKLARSRGRIAEDCAGNEPFEHALDDFDAVRDRIVESAVLTDRGQKTKAEQREYERTQLREFDAELCRRLAGQPASPECKRHFRSCDDVL